MKVFLKKDVEKIGMAGEILNVTDGFARNYLLPRRLATEITASNERQFKKQVTQVAHRKDVIASKTSMLAERIKNMTILLPRKIQNNGRLYGAINPHEIVDALAKEGISVTKSQVIFNKSIKHKGDYPVTIKLTSQLTPTMKVSVVPE